MTTPQPAALPELPEPELGYIKTDKSNQPAFSARQMRAALQSQPAADVSSGHIKEPYTLAELNARIASNDYNAELLLQHAMLLLNAQPAAVSDEEIERVLALAHAYADAKLMRYGQLGIKDLPDPQVAYEDLERAILALRPQAVPMTDEPEWIVNDLGELGVRVGSRFFFLYKGGNIEYGADGIVDSRDGVALHDDGTPMHYRIVGKREFGETCWPLQWVVRGHSERRYTEPLTFIPGLSWGTPEDGEWKPLPAHGITAQGAQGEQG